MTEPCINVPTGAVVEVQPPAIPAVILPAPPQSTMLGVVPWPVPPTLTVVNEGTVNTAYGEQPAGDYNGVNEVFTLSNDYASGTTQVTRNGLREQLGVSYTETPPNQITFTTAPLAGDVILVDYVIA